MAEYLSDARSTKDTPYLALTGELWGVFGEYLWKNWPCYNDTALLFFLPPPTPATHHQIDWLSWCSMSLHQKMRHLGDSLQSKLNFPDSKVHGANMGPIWGRQDPGGTHVGPMNFAIWVNILRPRHSDCIFQTAFSSAFSWMKVFTFRLRFHCSLYPTRAQLTLFQHWFR